MQLSPYIVPLVVAAILLRRAMRPQKPRAVRMQRLWIFPGVLLLVTVMSLWREGSPGFLLALVFVAIALAGAAIGWFRVHTLEFSLDAESGKVSARATQFGALLIVGLIGLRYLADVAIKQFGLNAGANLVHATDATLIFTTSMFVARSVHTSIRARALIAAHKAAIPSSREAGERVRERGGGRGERRVEEPALCPTAPSPQPSPQLWGRGRCHACSPRPSSIGSRARRNPRHACQRSRNGPRNR